MFILKRPRFVSLKEIQRTNPLNASGFWASITRWVSVNM